LLITSTPGNKPIKMFLIIITPGNVIGILMYITLTIKVTDLVFGLPKQVKIKKL